MTIHNTTLESKAGTQLTLNLFNAESALVITISVPQNKISVIAMKFPRKEAEVIFLVGCDHTIAHVASNISSETQKQVTIYVTDNSQIGREDELNLIDAIKMLLQ